MRVKLGLIDSFSSKLVQVDKKDALPITICNSCHQTTEKLHGFVENCQKIQKELSNFSLCRLCSEAINVVNIFSLPSLKEKISDLLHIHASFLA